jgi:hypothetical protein
MKYYVAAVRDWDEQRMRDNLEFATELGSFESFITSDYKTLRGLIKYRILEHPSYYSHVWAVFEDRGDKPDKFVGLQYNLYDIELCKLATRYIKARKANGCKQSGVSLYERV